MENIELGDLETYITPKLIEEDARSIAKQLLDGLEILHGMGWAHRDLKPRNILVVEAAPNWWVKIGDFGISKRLRNDQETQTLIGTPDYIAPEISIPDTLSSHDSDSDDEKAPRPTIAVDIWSLGCVLYRLLTRQIPFPSQKALKSYCRGKSPLCLGPVNAQQVSKNGIDLLLSMLKPHPEVRITTASALKHPWVNVELFERPIPSATSQGNLSDVLSKQSQATKVASPTNAMDLIPQDQDIPPQVPLSSHDFYEPHGDPTFSATFQGKSDGLRSEPSRATAVNDCVPTTNQSLSERGLPSQKSDFSSPNLSKSEKERARFLFNGLEENLGQLATMERRRKPWRSKETIPSVDDVPQTRATAANGPLSDTNQALPYRSLLPAGLGSKMRRTPTQSPNMFQGLGAAIGLAIPEGQESSKQQLVEQDGGTEDLQAIGRARRKQQRERVMERDTMERGSWEQMTAREKAARERKAREGVEQAMTERERTVQRMAQEIWARQLWGQKMVEQAERDKMERESWEQKIVRGMTAREKSKREMMERERMAKEERALPRSMAATRKPGDDPQMSNEGADGNSSTKPRGSVVHAGKSRRMQYGPNPEISSSYASRPSSAV